VPAKASEASFQMSELPQVNVPQQLQIRPKRKGNSIYSAKHYPGLQEWSGEGSVNGYDGDESTDYTFDLNKQRINVYLHGEAYEASEPLTKYLHGVNDLSKLTEDEVRSLVNSVLLD
jgi:hypothetical protein